MTGTDAREILSFAQSEIRRYLALAGLNDCPPIQADSDDEAHDAYTIRGGPDGIALHGSNPRSALIGAYAYLKEIGFAFFAPGDDHTRIPRLTDKRQLTVPPIARRAENAFRGVCIEGATSVEHVLSYVDWLPKAGMNLCFLQFFRPDVFFERWYAHENNPALPPRGLTEEEKAACDRTVTQAIRQRGLLLHRAGHGWTARTLGYPGNGWQPAKEPTDEKFRSRLALYQGKRQLYQGVPANTNLCYAREDVRQALIQEVVAYARAHPEADALHFWLADTYNNLCECEACRKTTLSDQYVSILNRLDEALTREGLPTRIVFLLYQELLYPPERERIHRPDRFLMMFAPISRTFETPYPAALPEGPLPPYRRNGMTLPLGLADNLRFYAAWRRVFPGECFIYDYHLGRAHYGDPGYMKIARTLSADLQTLRPLGFMGMVACQELRVNLPNALPIYLMGRQLWGDETPFDGICRDYFTGLYGHHAALAEDYFRQVSALCDTDYANANGPRLRPDLTERYREIARLSRETEQKAPSEGDPILARFQSVLRQNAAYADAVAALTAGNETAEQAACDQFLHIIRDREKTWPEDYDVYRAVEVTSRYTGLTPTPQPTEERDVSV